VRDYLLWTGDGVCQWHLQLLWPGRLHHLPTRAELCQWHLCNGLRQPAELLQLGQWLQRQRRLLLQHHDRGNDRLRDVLRRVRRPGLYQHGAMPGRHLL
jgi:hypothetical protein